MKRADHFGILERASPLSTEAALDITDAFRYPVSRLADRQVRI